MGAGMAAPFLDDTNSSRVFAGILALCETLLFTMRASSDARRRHAVVFFVAILASIVFVAGFAALHPRDWSVPPAAKRAPFIARSVRLATAIPAKVMATMRPSGGQGPRI